MKFSSQEIGVIFGSINYENMAGIEQNNLLTQEIFIDLIDFIYPADIHINDFRNCWAKYGIFLIKKIRLIVKIQRQIVKIQRL